jgi:hypothetical protein
MARSSNLDVGYRLTVVPTHPRVQWVSRLFPASLATGKDATHSLLAPALRASRAISLHPSACASYGVTFTFSIVR